MFTITCARSPSPDHLPVGKADGWHAGIKEGRMGALGRVAPHAHGSELLSALPRDGQETVGYSGGNGDPRDRPPLWGCNSSECLPVPGGGIEHCLHAD